MEKVISLFDSPDILNGVSRLTRPATQIPRNPRRFNTCFVELPKNARQTPPQMGGKRSAPSRPFGPENRITLELTDLAMVRV